MILKNGSRGLFVHRFDSGRFKLLVPARQFGDVRHLVGHRVTVGQTVHDTNPEHAFKGVWFVEIIHDQELCEISGECFRPELARIVARADLVAAELLLEAKGGGSYERVIAPTIVKTLLRNADQFRDGPADFSTCVFEGALREAERLLIKLREAGDG